MGASQEECCRTLVTYLRVNPQGRGVFDEGFNDPAAAECVRSHHQHLVLLHSVEERSHVGPDRLQIDDQKHQIKAWKALEHNKTPKTATWQQRALHSDFSSEERKSYLDFLLQHLVLCVWYSGVTWTYMNVPLEVTGRNKGL